MEDEKDIKEFLSYKKSLLIAPAGYGKTYSIVQCVKYASGKSLILTHTHAGISAIKNKLNEQDIPKQSYQIETITSYAQKYVKAYYTGNIPDTNSSDEYWAFILKEAEKIFLNQHIKDVLSASYDRLFVDEYQDCTMSQHKMVLALAETLNTHILGDPLQGIIDFDKNEILVDFNKDLEDFEKVDGLSTPYRWKQKGSNEKLGDFLVETREFLRQNLEENKQNRLDLSVNKQRAFKLIKTDGDATKYNEFKNLSDNKDKETGLFRTYKEAVRAILENKYNKSELESLLIIMPDVYHPKKRNIELRAELKTRLGFPKLFLVESIDDKSFYELALTADKIIEDKLTENLSLLKEQLLNQLFSSSEINNWINEKYKIRNKTKEEDLSNHDELERRVNVFKVEPNTNNLNKVLCFFKEELALNCNRPSIYYSLRDALISTEDGNSVYDTMVSHRNRIRRVGRKIDGKCIGTTALTKGLEFDTVVILDAHNFKCPKNLYVAMTRASKNLIIFSKTPILEPYKKKKIKNL